MSLILDGALFHVLVPLRYGYLYDNQVVTVFAPPDDVFRFDNWKTTGFYVVISSVVDTHSSIDFLFTCSNYTWRYTSHELTVVKVPDGCHPWINNINITRSNIYNDGRMIVHGVDKLFSWFDNILFLSLWSYISMKILFWNFSSFFELSVFYFWFEYVLWCNVNVVFSNVLSYLVMLLFLF
jgi:NAD-dependent dihydropyrimidine dehydrogenase PreA subunit